MRKARQSKLRLSLTVIMAGLCAVPIAAQTTAFTYQGKLTDAGNPANGTYDMQFKLFDSAAVGTGTEQGATITNPTVQVTNGIFAVNLDFGANVFTAAARFLEIGVRPAGNTNPYTVLAPRQPITSSPYAIQTLNATQLGGLPASRYVAADVNGNVGIGTATPSTKLEVVHPISQLRFGATTTDNGGYLISRNPSEAIIAGGARWDGANWIARDTAATMTAHQNGTIQFFANSNLTVGSPFNPTLRMYITSDNFFGENSFVSIGSPAAPGRLNVYNPNGFGLLHTNDLNEAIVSEFDGAGVGRLGTLNNHGLDLITNHTSRIILDTLGHVGIGTGVLSTKLEVVDPVRQLRFGPTAADNGGYLISTNPSQAIIVGGAKFDGTNWIARDSAASLTAHFDGVIQFTTNSSLGVGSPFNPTERMRIAANGNVGIGTNAPDQLLSVNGNASKIGGGSWATFSDERLKTIHGTYTRGLTAVMQLQPIRFAYKPDNALGLRGTGEYIGFSAQAVERILPEAVTRSASGYLQINNDPILWTMLNAVKEQQAQIAAQQGQIESQQRLLDQQQRQFREQQQELEALRKRLCSTHSKAADCQAKRRR